MSRLAQPATRCMQVHEPVLFPVLREGICFSLSLRPPLPPTPSLHLLKLPNHRKKRKMKCLSNRLESASQCLRVVGEWSEEGLSLQKAVPVEGSFCSASHGKGNFGRQKVVKAGGWVPPGRPGLQVLLPCCMSSSSSFLKSVTGGRAGSSWPVLLPFLLLLLEGGGGGQAQDRQAGS